MAVQSGERSLAARAAFLIAFHSMPKGPERCACGYITWVVATQRWGQLPRQIKRLPYNFLAHTYYGVQGRMASVQDTARIVPLYFMLILATCRVVFTPLQQLTRKVVSFSLLIPCILLYATNC
jgi:hypothetical protein